jgi:hypothetical protein
MSALTKSGMKFRKIVNEDGTVEHWKQPRLADWEKPRTDPREKRPLHPQVREKRRDARRRWQDRQRARDAAKLAKKRDDPACGDSLHKSLAGVTLSSTRRCC